MLKVRVEGGTRVKNPVQERGAIKVTREPVGQRSRDGMQWVWVARLITRVHKRGLETVFARGHMHFGEPTLRKYFQPLQRGNGI